jgi:hypothetical protein
MRVRFVESQSPSTMALESLFRDRGHAVSHSDQVSTNVDVHIFRRGRGAMKSLTRGLVVLDLRDEIENSREDWTPYADLCLVREDRQWWALVKSHGCEPERVRVAADEATVVSLLESAFADSLTEVGMERQETTMTDQNTVSEVTARQMTASLAARMDLIERSADIMQRDYRVRSRLPVVGPLAAWVRRNLTSHLREPYLDPALERQVKLNRDVISLVKEAHWLLEGMETRLARVEEELRRE